jgi:hypothetical protein
MSNESDSASIQSNSDNETNDKSKALVNYSKKSIFLYDKKCRTVLQLGVLYKNLSKAATNAINLDKITKKIQSMIDKNQIYLRDVGPIILGITKIVVKKTFFLYKDIEELTNLRINVRESKRIYENKDSEDNSEIKKIGSKKLLENDKEGTLAMNINSLDTDGLNYQNNSLANNGSELRNKLRAGNKYNNELTFSKDIIEITNDDMVNRTIQKMSRLENSDIKELISTNKKNKNDTNKFGTENKNSKTLKNLRDMLLNKNGHNKNNNNNLPEINLEYSVNNFDGSVNLDQNNKDVDNFFTVVKSQIVDDNNNEKINDDGNIEQNFDFEINMNDFKDDLYSNKKYNINKDEIKKNLKSKINKKSEFMKGNAKLKYDDDIEMELDINNYDNTKKSKFDEIQKRLERENKFKLENIQVNTDVFLFDKNKLTSFANEKYEYLLPQFLEIREDTNELNDPNNNEKIDSYLKIRNESNINNSESKSDITRAERFTTSNKKKISLDNFDSSNLLMNNLSRLTLDKNDFKGAKSFIEKLNIMDKDTKDENNKDEINLNSNINNDMDLINDDNELNDNYNNESILPENKNKEIKSSEELKEEEDANLLKEDLQNNVFKKSKKKVSFEKIREKLENKDKFENPKLFYDLLLLAQKGDVELTQNEIMDNKGINVSLKY